MDSTVLHRVHSQKWGLHLVYTGQYDLGFSGLRDTHLPGAVTQPFAPRPSAFGEDERFTWRRVSRPFVFEDDTKMTQRNTEWSMNEPLQQDCGAFFLFSGQSMIAAGHWCFHYSFSLPSVNEFGPHINRLCRIFPTPPPTSAVKQPRLERWPFSGANLRTKILYFRLSYGTPHACSAPAPSVS
ncbi:hypothetical protein FA13DRAFT_955317 [Coprinellus micaceus]|uniref:Uncharacterized protein n=1 Tax=Coprinellus micaceus TaxID=71717 RepID=A0A4Y7RY04_COPMI|nr:hypothetical protein FA13DRAFT_955317 [Coprinellus micaceus]